MYQKFTITTRPVSKREIAYFFNRNNNKKINKSIFPVTRKIRI